MMYDNALAETINGLYKTEVIRPNGPCRSREEAEFATLEPIGDIPPAEFEAMYDQQQGAPATGAALN